MHEWPDSKPQGSDFQDTLLEERSLPPIARIAGELRDQRARIIGNWLLRAASLPVFRAMPDLSKTEVQKLIPGILDSALGAISTSDADPDPGGLAQAVALSAQHGAARVADGFQVTDLLQEFQALRHEVWAAIWRVTETALTSVAMIKAMQSRLLATFDAISNSAVDAWMQETERT